MILVEIVPQRPTDKHKPMVFDNFRTFSDSVALTWSRSKFKGEIVPTKDESWKVYEVSPMGLKKHFANATERWAVDAGTIIYSKAEHL